MTPGSRASLPRRICAYRDWSTGGDYAIAVSSPACAAVLLPPEILYPDVARCFLALEPLLHEGWMSPFEGQC